MSDHKSFIVIFKKDAPQSEIDSQVSEIESQGGKITQKYEGLMKGFAAQMPPTIATALSSASEGGKHPHIDYVEPDQEVRAGI
ncbi:unnamed protein product [Tilletia controversa]|uniref:Inhibitor I9 domain-containing protein n=3 Tax=Tilletia TaxID=13289 RepID=A0A8X7N0M4_9BASI|nr:hypothetical protein CF336_g125 [Tilletia laevis]KAE8206091.1 hypothetical protein CF328_g106 [Tilletia controversa]KAE8265675.1 hypothetical protein A4X03_0g106 [Tilletia caries]KAE8208851.1 hypothetical protein CF335_g115 [Tilletia laevis]KAE8255823.1 hypothetical protein A4X06_0g239 [Tilletia controversa]